MTIQAFLLFAWRRAFFSLHQIITTQSVKHFYFPGSKNLVIKGFPFLDIHPLSNVSIGHSFVLTSHHAYNSLGVGHASVIKVFPGAFLTIGSNVGMSSVRLSCTHGINVGSNVLIGADSLITDSDFHPLDPLHRDDPLRVKTKPVVISDNVFIGAKTIILKGSFIGANSIIGAGSVVSGYIPPMVIAAGNPAKVIRSISDVSA